ncbi:chemotaxis protein CheV [Shouchella shacheensis]|uniref:chemotaxis protein CheV n=1 Tax=Shouchella shacheensis TaxID=1649580 RepID=UPI00074028E0|nr:chemotaxis protein [Shouchella shacheensis]
MNIHSWGTTQELDLELVLFYLDDSLYALNVLKVREVIRPIPVTSSPNRHTIVEGVVRVRDEVMPLLNMFELLEVGGGSHDGDQFFIIVEMGNQRLALRVGRVSTIHRLASSDLQVPDSITSGKEQFVSGVVHLEEANQMVFTLDLEKVVHLVRPQAAQATYRAEELVKRGQETILLVEDSKTLRTLLIQSLFDAGYDDVTYFDNGEDAWKYMQDPSRVVSFTALVTDIEMPKMNGHMLTKHVRELPGYLDFPIITFSSLSANVTQEKGKRLGVTAHISKPDVAALVHALDECLQKETAEDV